MCRIFGYTTKNPKKTNNLLIKSLEDFRVLAKNGCVPCGIKKGHNDGWGIVLYKNKVPCFYYRSTTSIMKDGSFDEVINLIKNIKPDIVITHLRKMSRGLKTIENTQPFLSNNFSLVHNGTIMFNDSQHINDKSDTLLFFNKITNGKTSIPISFFKNEYINTSLNNNFTSMNMIFSDGLNLYAVKNINNKNIESDKFCFNEYFTLSSFYYHECLFVCSEKISSLLKTKEKVLKNGNIYKY